MRTVADMFTAAYEAFINVLIYFTLFIIYLFFACCCLLCAIYSIEFESNTIRNKTSLRFITVF